MRWDCWISGRGEGWRWKGTRKKKAALIRNFRNNWGSRIRAGQSGGLPGGEGEKSLLSRDIRSGGQVWKQRIWNERCRNLYLRTPGSRKNIHGGRRGQTGRTMTQSGCGTSTLTKYQERQNCFWRSYEDVQILFRTKRLLSAKTLIRVSIN